MRIPFALIAGLLVVPLASAATRPATHNTLTMKVSATKVLYGHGATISGRLWGAGHANRPVVVDARPYGASAPHRVAILVTDAAGRWAFRASPGILTSYQAQLGNTMSRRLTIGVAPAMSVETLASGRLRVHVQATRRFAGRFVELQMQKGPRWTTVDRKPLNRAATAVFIPKLGSATLRVAMSVNQAGAGYLGAASHAFAYRPQSLTLAPSTLTVLYGHRVSFAGRVVNGRAGEAISITARRWGHQDSLFTQVTTGRDGRFTFAARPGILTMYTARLRTGQLSPKIVVDVRPTITVRELGNGRVQTHVAGARSFRGRMVQLQQLSGSRWQTMAKAALHAGSTATFALPLRSSLIRVAMSVNQAGSGYTGSASHAVSYRAV